MTLPDLHITGLYGLAQAVACFSPDLIISIGEADEADCARNAIGATRAHVIRAEFGDTFAGEPGAPTKAHLEQIASDIQIPPQRLLVHCAAGISRSPAVAAFVLARHADSLGLDAAKTAHDIARAVYACSPHIHPHPELLEMAEDLVAGYKGHLISSFEALRPKMPDIESVW